MKQKTIPQLIVMLTYNDFTVENAEEIFEQCKHTDALYWGMKEKPLPLERLKALYARMKECGKKTVLEVVGYSEEEGLRGARLAAECGCDMLMGTTFSQTIADYCVRHKVCYLPFVGEITGRPSIMRGDADVMVRDALEAVKGGAAGIDLLAYRYVGNPEQLIHRFVEEVEAPLCVAGSIDSYSRLDILRKLGPDYFTIGGAFFENKFGESFPEEIDSVIAHVTR